MTPIENNPEIIHGNFRIAFFTQAETCKIYADIFDRQTGTHLHTTLPVKGEPMARSLAIHWVRLQQEQKRTVDVTGEDYITA